MKKLLFIALLAIVSSSTLLTSCTEENVKPKDNSGETRDDDGHW